MTDVTHHRVARVLAHVLALQCVAGDQDRQRQQAQQLHGEAQQLRGTDGHGACCCVHVLCLGNWEQWHSRDRHWCVVVVQEQETLDSPSQQPCDRFMMSSTTTYTGLKDGGKGCSGSSAVMDCEHTHNVQDWQVDEPLGEKDDEDRPSDVADDGRLVVELLKPVGVRAGAWLYVVGSVSQGGATSLGGCVLKGSGSMNHRCKKQIICRVSLERCGTEQLIQGSQIDLQHVCSSVATWQCGAGRMQ